jgi:hypothetical protein
MDQCSIVVNHGQSCSIVLYRHKKGLSPKAISDDLVAMLGSDVMADAPVARSVHDAKSTHPKVISPPNINSR